MTSRQAIPRVLLVGPEFAGGGMQTHFRNIAERVFEGRADVLTLRDTGLPAHPPPDRVLRSLGWTSERSYPRIVRELRRQIRAGRYDAVLALGIYPNLVVWCATRALPDRPGIALCEGNRPQVATREAQHRPLTKIKNWLVPFAYRDADVMGANSIDGVNDCITMYRVKPERVVRIPNLADAKDVKRRGAEPLTAPWPENKYTIVTACRLVRWKRIDDVIQALARLPAALDCALAVIGDGPERGSLGRLAESLGVADRVHFYGWQENAHAFIARSTVHILASEYEGFSNSILEAMFLDIPNITSLSTSDAREMCDKGAALGFEVGDVDGLAEKLSEALTSPALRAQIVSAADVYRAPHEMAAAVRFYEDLLRRAAHRGRQDRAEVGDAAGVAGAKG